MRALPERLRIVVRLPGVQLDDADKLTGQTLPVQANGEPLRSAVIGSVEQFSDGLHLEILATQWPTEPCRSRRCGMPIIWAWAGSRCIPLDAAASTAGSYAVEDGTRDGEAVTVCREVARPLRFGRRDLRTSHFATCAFADDWRKAR